MWVAGDSGVFTPSTERLIFDSRSFSPFYSLHTLHFNKAAQLVVGPLIILIPGLKDMVYLYMKQQFNANSSCKCTRLLMPSGTHTLHVLT